MIVFICHRNRIAINEVAKELKNFQVVSNESLCNKYNIYIYNYESKNKVFKNFLKSEFEKDSNILFVIDDNMSLHELSSISPSKTSDFILITDDSSRDICKLFTSIITIPKYYSASNYIFENIFNN